METHIKRENLADAVEAIEELDVHYKIKRGYVYGLKCYWIELVNHPNRMKALQALFKFSQQPKE